MSIFKTKFNDKKAIFGTPHNCVLLRPMISVNSVTVSFGGFNLFDNISFLINSKDRIGLAGKNGAGKSTMLKLIAGEENPTKGDISTPRDIRSVICHKI